MKVTQEQLDDMLHAVGISHGKTNLGWRNYYNSDNRPHLDDLVAHGLMGRSGNNYYVRRAGWKVMDKAMGEDVTWNHEFLEKLLREDSETALILQDYGQENDCTAFPFWGIAKEIRSEVILISNGFWFSRRAAAEHLKSASHHYPKKAFVYGFSGHQSSHNRRLEKLAKGELCEGVRA